MEQKNELEQGDEIMLPGFRFHPTDEELVAFYLRRKVQKRPLSIELIKQLDIYKFDPWDLPKMASIGEKEWYFYCPRDRKYRNSNRPNRVTTAGFWKATGTDRPIYSSDGTNCIGLKKSLVFYKGRAAKGIKTDWMMHEFRLPTQLPLSSPCKRPLDKDLPPNDSWAICRIFKKSTVAQRVPHHMWTPPMVDRTFESSCNNNYSYTNIMDIPQLKTSNGDVQTHNASTNAIPSSIMAGTHEEFQFLNQQQPTNMAAFGSCKFSHAKSIPCFLPARSLSLPNLEYSNTSDQSHYNEHSAEKSTLNFVSYMLQMPPPADDVSKTHNFSPDISTSTDHHQQQQEAEAFLKKNSIFNSMIPMPGNISLCNSLPFQSNLYDVLKGVNTNQWDIPTSAIL